MGIKGKLEANSKETVRYLFVMENIHIDESSDRSSIAIEKRGVQGVNETEEKNGGQG